MTGHANDRPAILLSGASLRAQLKRVDRRHKWTAILLVAPLVFFLILNFIVPVATLLFRSVDDREVSRILHRTDAVIGDWDGVGLPGEPVFAALAADLVDAQRANTANALAKRMNSIRMGFQALIRQTARGIPEGGSPSYTAALQQIDPRWGETGTWVLIKRAARPYTADYFLSAFDITVEDDGSLAMVAEDRRVLSTVWMRSFWMAGIITLICAIAGYPVAYGLSRLPTRTSNLLMLFVLLPFWTAALVRTTAWIVLLQNHGVVNTLGIASGLWDEPLQMVRNRFGVYVAMAHVLIPYMVLPLFATMKRIPTAPLRAAQSLGASPWVAFLRVYFPQTLQALGTGSLFVFILAIGFYITPALVGGKNDQMITWYIAFFTSTALNWGAAAALSTVLLAFTTLLYFLMDSLFGVSRMRLR